jgi:hypothetical protein
MRRFRWSDGPNDFAGAVPRSAATLRSPIVDDVVIRRRGRDQRQLLARLSQHGVSGDWSAEDANGNPCVVENGPNGLEIYAGQAAEGDQAGPEMVGTAPPGAANNLDALRKRMAPRPMHDRTLSSQQQGDQLRAMQAYLNEIHRPR